MPLNFWIFLLVINIFICCPDYPNREGEHIFLVPVLEEQPGSGWEREAVVEWTQQLKLPLPCPGMHVVHQPVSQAPKEEEIHELQSFKSHSVAHESFHIVHLSYFSS